MIGMDAALVAERRRSPLKRVARWLCAPFQKAREHPPIDALWYPTKFDWQIYRAWPWVKLPRIGADGEPLGYPTSRRWFEGAWQYRTATEEELRSDMEKQAIDCA